MRQGSFFVTFPQPVFQQVGEAGTRAATIAGTTPATGGASYVDLTVPELLLDARRAYDDEIYQNLMAYAAELHMLGVIAGVIDGPTEQYRAAIAEAAGSYLGTLVDQSQRTNIFQGFLPLNLLSTAGGAINYAVGGVMRGVGTEGSTLQEYGESLTDSGETMMTTNVDAVAGAMIVDLVTSIGNDAEARWDEFQADVDTEGYLSALAQLKADADFLAAEIAIDIALTALTGGTAAFARIIVRRVGRATSRITIRVVDAATNAVPDADIVRRLDGVNDYVDLPDDDVNETISRQILDEEQLRTRSERGDLETRAEQPDPGAEEPSGGAAADETPNSRNRTDEWEDGSYRNPSDPEGVRRTADGEAMIQNKEGTWRPVSQMADPARDGDNGRRHNPQVGRWGEVEADRYAASQGWERIDGDMTTMDSPFTGPQRIDAIYRDPGPPPRYIVSDAKAMGSPQLRTQAGVLQMSEQWISDRLGNSPLSRADLRAIEDGYDSVILRVDSDGNVTETWLDANGSPIAAPAWRTE